MPAPTNYQCCEMCHRTGDQLDELMAKAELEGKFRRKMVKGKATGARITPEQEERLRERFEIKRVLLDGDMETEMCGFCIRVVGKAMKVEVL